MSYHFQGYSNCESCIQGKTKDCLSYPDPVSYTHLDVYKRQAEGVMLHLIKEAGLENEIVIDSAGILSYHQGELPDSRMRAHAARRGYQLVHRSRPAHLFPPAG